MLSSISAFLLSCRAAGLASKTVTWYAANLRAFALFARDRDWLDPDTCRQFIVNLSSCDTLYADHPYRLPKAGRYSVYTLRARLRSLKRFFNWLFEEGRINTNPARLLRMPRTPRLLPRGISTCDFERLLAATDSDRDAALLLVLRDTGCRSAEIAGLRVRDVDIGKGIAVVIGKGGQERFTFLSPLTCKALKKWLGVRAGLAPDDPVFVTAKGPFRPCTLNEVLRRLASKAGVTGRVNPHSFRHAFARDWLLSGGDLVSLSHILGHVDIQTTRIYASFATAELQEMHRRHSPLADRRANDS